MRVIVAPNSFKGSLTSREAAEAVALGVRAAAPQAEILKYPLADGGEGTMELLVEATGGSRRQAWVTGPLGEPVLATYGILGDRQTAVIEMAQAAGLLLVPPGLRDPSRTTTRGVGELVRRCLDEGCRRFIIGLGGSASNDGGAGLAAALGVRFLDDQNRNLGPGGGELSRLSRIDASEIDPRVGESSFVGACDVDNPLSGPRGASLVFGPQKGASPEQAAWLDRNLQRLGAIMERDLGKRVASLSGAGAAGGLGAGLLAFCGAEMRSGARLVIDATGLQQALPGSDLVFTGEGKVDDQTASGKAPLAVAAVAAQFGIPVVVLAGAVGAGTQALLQIGITALFSLCDGPMTVADAMADGRRLLTQAAEQAARLFLAGKNQGAPEGRLR